MAGRFHLGTQSGGLLLKLEPPPHPGAIGATHHRDHLTVASERNVGTTPSAEYARPVKFAVTRVRRNGTTESTKTSEQRLITRFGVANEDARFAIARSLRFLLEF